MTGMGENEVLLGFIGNVSPMNLILILLLVLILFGAKRIPELAKGLGSGMREFKKAMKEADPDNASAIEKTPSSDKESS